jgi:hypothetical protein
LAEESNGQEKKDLMPSYGGHDAVAVSAEEEDKYYTKRTAFAEEAERDEFMELASIEEIFSSEEVPSWQKQLTLRAFVVSFILTVLFTLIHSYEAEPHHRDYTVPQRLRRAVGLLLRQDMDQFPREGRYTQAAVYPAREHCYSDLRRCLLWHCFQRYALYFVETYTLDNTWPPCMHMCAYLFIFLKLHFYN